MTDPAFTLAKQEADAQLVVATGWWQLLNDFTIENDEQQEQVVGVLREVKSRYKLIEARRTEITGPLNQALRSVNDLFRPPKERFEALERLLKQKVAGYMAAKQAANVAVLETAVQAPTAEAANQAIAQVAPVAAPAGVSVRPVWKFEVTDPDLVPRELCSPDPKKIGSAFRAGPDGQPVPVPGVRWFQDSVVSVR